VSATNTYQQLLSTFRQLSIHCGLNLKTVHLCTKLILIIGPTKQLLSLTVTYWCWFVDYSYNFIWHIFAALALRPPKFFGPRQKIYAHHWFMEWWWTCFPRWSKKKSGFCRCRGHRFLFVACLSRLLTKDWQHRSLRWISRRTLIFIDHWLQPANQHLFVKLSLIFWSDARLTNVRAFFITFSHFCTNKINT